MVPKTADGRVLFAVPWLGKVILGTTDSPRQDVVREPLPFKEEVAFILNESARYLSRAGARKTFAASGWACALWSNRRMMMVATPRASAANTPCWPAGGLVTVTGGKWTTYRAMAEDVLQKCFDTGCCLPRRLALPISFRWWDRLHAGQFSTASATPLASISMARSRRSGGFAR